MKCPYCNAEVKKGQTVCPYCDSEIEIRDAGKAGDEAAAKRRSEMMKTIIKAIVITVVIIAVCGTLLLLGTLAIALRFGSESGMGNGNGSGSILLKSATDIEGVVLSDSGDGKICLQYVGKEYKDVEILDKELLGWLEETGESLEDRKILFSTNEDGDIRKIALGSAATFMILDADADSGIYTACMGPQIIRFTSQTLLQKNTLYEGYFSYPKRELVSVRLSTSYEGVSMYYDAVSEGKRSVQKEVLYTGEEVTLYQIGYGGNWYYCSQEIYDTLEDGDRLINYTFYNMPPCVTYP